MKNLHFFLIVLLIIEINLSCKKDSADNSYDYMFINDYIRDTVKVEINKGTIGNKHLFVINEKTLTESEINSKLTSIKKEDIISINFIDKTQAIKGSYPLANDGVVKINYYIDSLLKPNYYNINNTYIMGVLNDLINQKKVTRFPLIVLNGKPLRGTEIKTAIDPIKPENIKAIDLAIYDRGLSVYGERAINGVVFITTNN